MSASDGWTTGQRLERYLYDHGVTRYMLCEGAGVSKSSLSRICSGDNAGRVDTWRRIAEYLGTTVDELMRYEGDFE